MKRPSRTLQEEVEGGIRAWVLSGQYAQGAWLPSIAQLCKHFKVSDKTVKIALNRLKQDGVLKGVNGRGLQVCRRQKQVLLLSRRKVKPDWSNMSDEEKVLREAVLGWHERIDVLGRDNDGVIGPDLERNLAAIRSADVVLTYGIQNDPYHLQLAEAGRPVLAIDYCPQRAAVSSVSHASFQAGYAAAQHFLDLGHRRVVFLGVSRRLTISEPVAHVIPLPENDTELAEAGYRQAFRDAGIECPAKYMGREFSGRPPEDLLRLVEQTPAPTAVLCWINAGRFDARGTLEKAGWKVPSQISLCQVMDQENPGADRFPGTALEYDMRPVLSLAVRCIFQLLADPKTAPQVAQVIPKLRIGDTSAPVQSENI